MCERQLRQRGVCVLSLARDTRPGRRIRLQVLDTSTGVLVDVLRGIGGGRHVCLEEGTPSSWLYEVLEPHAAEVAERSTTAFGGW